MLTLRRADVTAFWILATALVAGLVSLVATAVGASTPWLWAPAATLILIPGLMWPAWFTYGVRAWNKGAHLSARALRTYVLRVCYYVIFSGLGPAGASLQLTGGAEPSRWVPHGAGNPSPNMAQPSTSDRSAGGLMMASARPGARWMLVLMPMMLLLRVLGDQHVDSAPASSTYTLY